MVSQRGLAELQRQQTTATAANRPDTSGGNRTDPAVATVTEAQVKKQAGQAAANLQMVQGLGAILGTLLAPLLGARLGRRPAYFILCLASLLICGYTFRTVNEYGSEF